MRYIGKSTKGLQRPREHTAPSQIAQGAYRCRWVQSLLDAGLMYGIRVLEECAGAHALGDAERRWIAHGRAQGWPLTNLTDGGDGAPGWVPSAATRALMSVVGTKNKTPEVRARMSASAKRRTARPEERARMAAIAKLASREKSPQTRARLSASLRGKAKPYMAERNRTMTWTPEMRAKVGAATRAAARRRSRPRIRINLIGLT